MLIRYILVGIPTYLYILYTLDRWILKVTSHTNNNRFTFNRMILDELKLTFLVNIFIDLLPIFDYYRMCTYTQILVRVFLLPTVVIILNTIFFSTIVGVYHE